MLELIYQEYSATTFKFTQPSKWLVLEPLEGLCCVSETKSHEQKFPQAKRRCYRRFFNVFFGDGNLVVGFN